MSHDSTCTLLPCRRSEVDISPASRIGCSAIRSCDAIPRDDRSNARIVGARAVAGKGQRPWCRWPRDRPIWCGLKLDQMRYFGEGSKLAHGPVRTIRHTFLRWDFANIRERLSNDRSRSEDTGFDQPPPL